MKYFRMIMSNIRLNLGTYNYVQDLNLCDSTRNILLLF